MIRLPFLSLARTSQFLGADSGLECAALWHDGTTLWLVSAGQSGGWAQRERVWVHDRLPGGPHAEKAYSGYWGRSAVPQVVIPKNLSIAGATLETTPQGFPLARVPAGTPTATWEPVAGATWQTQILNALTGATLTTLSGGQSAILRVRAQGIEPTYSWPPPNYQAVSGESSDTPSKFAWTHPTRGVMYFDPRFGVGARPYDRSDLTQERLLDAESAARANGTAKKEPSWVTYLIEFNEDGSPVTSNGEWSMLRVVCGNGAWIGDQSVHVGATTPVLWRMPLNPLTIKPNGALVPWVIDPTLRMVGALEVGASGELLIGGAIAGRSGPIPAVLGIQSPDSSGDEATTDLTLSVFTCECCEPLGKGIRGLAETKIGVRAVSPCDSFRRDLGAISLFRRLIPLHPGGRNAIVIRKNGVEIYVFTTEGGDFATSGVHQKAHGYIVLEDGSGQARTGAPLAKQLDSCLATMGGQLFWIEEWSADGSMPYEQTLEARLKSYQALCVSGDGAQGNRLVSWQVGDFDAGPVARCGNLSDGAALFAFGTTGEGTSMKGRALRLQGSVHTRNIDCDYFIQRVSTSRWNGEDWMVAIGLKTGGISREQFVLLSKGEPATVILTWNDDGFCAPLDAFEEWGIDISTLPLYLVWTGTCWSASETIPGDGTPYLVLEIGDGTVCYNLVGALPYDAEDFPAILFEEGVSCWTRIGPTNAADALDLMPDGTKISLCALSDYDELIADGQILQGEVGTVCYFPEMKHATIAPYRYESDYPFALWLRVDAETPLQLEPNGQITPAVRAQLAQFNQKAHFARKRSLSVPATERVEAVLLLAPGWKDDFRQLKARSA